METDMSKTDFDPTLEMVSFEAHRMVHEQGFILQLAEPDKLEFVKSEKTPDGVVFTMIDGAGNGAIGDPNDAVWTAFKKRYGPDHPYTSTVHEQTNLATVISNIHLLPDPTTRDQGMDVYQSWGELFVMSNKELTAPEDGIAKDARKIASDDGYNVYHTGGGIFAFHKKHPDNEDAHYYITAGDNGDLDQPYDEPVWTVGLYQTIKGQEDWVYVTEAVTLPEAIANAYTLPLPESFNEENLEKTFESWSEVAALASKPGL
jgi:hypothetical protein